MHNAPDRRSKRGARLAAGPQEEPANGVEDERKACHSSRGISSRNETQKNGAWEEGDFSGAADRPRLWQAQRDVFSAIPLARALRQIAQRTCRYALGRSGECFSGARRIRAPNTAGMCPLRSGGILAGLRYGHRHAQAEKQCSRRRRGSLRDQNTNVHTSASE